MAARRTVIGRAGASPPSRSAGAPLYIYIYIYLSAIRTAFWSPQAPALRANVKPARLGHESAKVDLAQSLETVFHDSTVVSLPPAVHRPWNLQKQEITGSAVEGSTRGIAVRVKV